jgi:hypothetical protein
MSEYQLVKKLGSYDNFKGLKSIAKVPRHKLFARNKLSAPTVVYLIQQNPCAKDQDGRQIKYRELKSPSDYEPEFWSRVLYRVSHSWALASNRKTDQAQRYLSVYRTIHSLW